MAPNQTSGATRGRPKGSKNAPKPRASRPPASSNPFASDEEQRRTASSDEEEVEEEEEEEEEEGEAPARAKRAPRGGEDAGSEEAEKTIPKELLTRLLHEFFAKDATRMSKDANAAVGKYVDIFVREAIARTAVEKQGGFLEVEDLEKIAPQLLLDL
ncbi:hypothetical protein NLU13_3370 [Sarocladium strictum]|uniref:Centromere protein X n=1 Tax=Sarocladium strictum TaxID=5046 RepID=A0AA39GLX6_SARSR|nr:hypothetical protein NLU13_3370 [Sarocladium strictum]